MTQEWKDQAAGDDVQMPLGVGGEGSAVDDYTPPKARVNTSTLALIASFLAALALLYFMGVQNKPRTATADQQKATQETDDRIKIWIQNQGGRQSVKNMTDRLLETLHKFMDGTRIAVLDPRVNPFQRKIVEVPQPKGGDEPRRTLPPELEDPGLKEVAKTFADLKLQLVMMNSPPSAMISNQLVSVGTKFGLLTVTGIQPDRVLLTYEGASGKKLVLSLYMNGAGADSKAVFGGSK